MSPTVIIILVVMGAAIGVGLFLYFKAKMVEEQVDLTPLPATSRKFPSIFQPFDGAGLEERSISRHGLYLHVPEAFGLRWEGRTGFTAPSLVGQFEPVTIALGIGARVRLKALNPDIKLFCQIGYTEGSDETCDFPPDHPWWLRVNGLRQPGAGDSHLFNLALPAVRQHCANCCKVALDTGIFDGLFLDVFSDDVLHVDLLRRIRALCGEAALIIVNGREREKSPNPLICRNLAPLVNGFFMECGPVTTPARWATVVEALDFNERHVRQPAMNCLEISGLRDDVTQMQRTTCLSLTSSNGYVLYADHDPASGGASTHLYAWHPLWDDDLGRALGPTRFVGRTRQRQFERGTIMFTPPV